MKDNITLLPGSPDEMRGQLETLRRNLPTILEFHVIDARIKRAKYDAYMAEGFDEKQALELCK